MKIFGNRNNRAFGMIEILVVVSLIMIGIFSTFSFTVSILKISNLNKQTTQANDLAIEALEAVRTFRDGTDWFVDGLGILDIGSVYHIAKTTDNPPHWQLVLGSENINSFTRQIVLSKVFRNQVTGNIAEAGIEDPKTRKATVTVSWNDKSVVLTTYLSDWR